MPPVTIEDKASPSRFPLSYQNYRWVFTGQFVSQIGSSAHAIGISFFLKETTQSGSIVGGALFLCGITALFMLPFAGVVADRRNRRSVVLVCDLINAFATLGLACAFLLMSQRFAIWLAGFAVLCNLMIAVSSAFFRPAFGAMLPDLAPQRVLASANSLYKAGARFGDLLGNAFGGIVYRAIGPTSLFFMNSISYFLSAFCVSRAGPGSNFLPKHEPKHMMRGIGGLLREFVTGVRALTSISGGKIFLSMALVINFFATPIFILMPFHVSGALHGDAAMYGSLMAALSIGVLVGYVVAATIPMTRITRPSIVIAIIIAMCGCFLLFSQLRRFSLAFISLLAAGIANGFWSIFFETALQSVIPREALGRVYACYGLLSGGLVPIASLAGGVILDIFHQDTRVLFTACSMAMTIYPVLLLGKKEFLSFFDSLRVASSRTAGGDSA